MQKLSLLRWLPFNKGDNHRIFSVWQDQLIIESHKVLEDLFCNLRTVASAVIFFCSYRGTKICKVGWTCDLVCLIMASACVSDAMLDNTHMLAPVGAPSLRQVLFSAHKLLLRRLEFSVAFCRTVKPNYENRQNLVQWRALSVPRLPRWTTKHGWAVKMHFKNQWMNNVVHIFTH